MACVCVESCHCSPKVADGFVFQLIRFCCPYDVGQPQWTFGGLAVPDEDASTTAETSICCVTLIFKLTTILESVIIAEAVLAQFGLECTLRDSCLWCIILENFVHI